MLTLFYFLLAILLLVSVHEYGHFLVARLCGVKVLRFSFGFGPVLWRCFDKKGTEYAFSLLPLGGYVKMLDEMEGPVLEEEKPFAFNTQSLGKRVAIVFAGPLFNFIFAFFAFWLVLVIGMHALAPIVGTVKQGGIAALSGLTAGDEIIALDNEPVRSWRDFQINFLSASGHADVLTLTVKSRRVKGILENPPQPPFVKGGVGSVTKNLELPLNNWQMHGAKQDLLESLGISPFIPKFEPVIGQVLPGSPGEKAGLLPLDRMIRVDGQPIVDWLAMVDFVKRKPGQMITLEIRRAGKMMTLNAQVGTKTVDGSTVGFLGLASQKPDWPADLIRTERATPWGAIPKALMQTARMTGMTLDMFVRLVTGRVGLDNLSGPVGIAQSAGESGRGGIVYYLSFLALVSISLGVLNLLPVPILDGGHLMYYFMEWIYRKPMSEHFRMIGNYVGLFLLVLLMAFSLVNDLTRLLG